MMTEGGVNSGLKWWAIPLIVLVVVLAVPLGLVLLILSALLSVILHLAIWTLWCLRGRTVLLVYSDSPVWGDYIRDRFLPYFEQRAIILNWSERQRWQFSLARVAFYHFGGGREFNPLAVVFRPFHRTRTFRFWKPFRDWKHGRPEALVTMERELFEVAGIVRPAA
jgi:hypothetical protein